MKSEIISVGTELLLGNIINTNTAYLSEELAKLGIDVYFHVTVGDNRERLTDTLRTAMGRSDLVITTGGLGPTTDDITKETIAEVAGRKLVLHRDEFKKLEAFFNRSGRKMTPNNIKQAYLPEGCLVVANDNGTAPGAIVELNGTTIIMLPGPPIEMKPMFQEKIVPYLRERSKQALVSVNLRFFGIGESALEHALYDLIKGQTEPTIATYAGEGEVKVRLTARSDAGGEVPPSITDMIGKIKERLGRYIYSYNDRPLQQVTAELLLKSGKTLAVAESCTAGKLSALITSVPGISKAYMGAVVSYNNQMKQKFLGVCEQTLENSGAVSEEAALQMAEGVRRACDADIGLSVTGIAGPDGGTDQKPVGLVYIALSSEDHTEIRELKFNGNREKIRTYAAKNALNLLRLYLVGDIASIDKRS
ncbi:MAG: competence/damage-inducible protein A [Clostridiales bacterium]|nr:competence/damage-inducible protein A [Clostridiales bacterium]